MIILDPGHRYLLDALDDTTHLGPRLLQFVKRQGTKYPGNTSSYPGTNSQETLRALIDRGAYLNKQIPCWQTRVGNWLMALVIWLYEHRAAGLHKRRIPSIREAVYGPTCRTCGHVGHECLNDRFGQRVAPDYD